MLAGRATEEALDSDSKVRCALTRLAAAVLDGRVDRGRANSAKFIIDGIAQRLDRQFEREARTRELDLKEQEIETARELSERLEAYRASLPPQVVQAVQVHVPALLGDAAAGVRTSAPALEHEGEVTP